MILKSCKLPSIDESKLFLVTPRGITLHQILPPPSSLTRNPVYYKANANLKSKRHSLCSRNVAEKSFTSYLRSEVDV